MMTRGQQKKASDTFLNLVKSPSSSIKSITTINIKKKNQKQKKKQHSSHHMPKKPPTAFFYFLEDYKKTYQLENPDVKSMRDIGKAGGEKWRTSSFEEKVAYYDIATEKRAEFEKAMAEYLKRKDDDELSEEESDYE